MPAVQSFRGQTLLSASDCRSLLETSAALARKFLLVDTESDTGPGLMVPRIARPTALQIAGRATNT